MSAQSASRNAKVITSLPLLVCLSSCQISALGQTSPSSRYESVLRTKVELNSDNVSLSQMLQRLHKEYRLNFVVSDIPLRKKATIQSSGTIADALDTLSAEFDYNWAMDKRGIILFTKAFREDDDLPQIHEAEIKRLAKETLEIFRSVPVSDTSWNDEVRKLAKTFTPEQWLVFKTGQSVAAQSLAPAQWQQIQLAGVANQVTDEKQRWQTLLNILTQLDSTALRIRPLKYDGMSEDAMPYRLFLYSKNSEERPLCDFALILRTDPEKKINRQESPVYRFQDNVYFEEIRGREHPEGIEGRWSKLITLSQEKMTIGEFFPLLSVTGELEYSSDPELKPRLMQVYCTGVTRRALTDAVAELEDWHWQEGKQGKVRFVRRTLKDTGEILAVPRRIQATLPRDLCSYFDTRRPTLTAATMTSTMMSNNWMQRLNGFNKRKWILRDAGIRRLIERFADDDRGETGIPVTKLKPEERRLLVTALLGETLNYMQFGIYGGDFPPYILAPQTAELALSGDMLQILTVLRDVKGNPSMGFGGNVADIIPKNGTERTPNP